MARNELARAERLLVESGERLAQAQARVAEYNLSDERVVTQSKRLLELMTASYGLQVYHVETLKQEIREGNGPPR